ncbi:lysophospholipid acyltransferase 7 [Cuculus canorus]|uniref:lysophospholipid acyltransferase 7 n=1 Tax=Cuculus canorus TaxID=55661 RepID=UPI0023AA92C8|nr:lysophospholipid acyltransferase 7 [Cuculus canorus]
MTPEEVTYLSVLLFSIPIGFLFKDLSPQARRWGGAAVGGALSLLTCGPHVLHSLVTTLGAWGLLRLLPGRCGAATLAWTFAYLLFFRSLWVWGLPEPPPYANALQLLLTLKLVSLAMDTQEPRGGDDPAVLGSLGAPPGLAETLSYSFCYLGLLTGPFYRLGTHRDWVLGPVAAPRWRRVLTHVRWTPVLGALGEAASRFFPLDAVRDPGFARHPFAFRLFYMVPVFFAFRMRFYVGWLCAEAACIAAGLGGYPPAAHPKPGAGPTRPCPRPTRAEAEASETWDFSAVRTIDPWGTERCRRFREGMRHWNMSVQWWLAQYVHRRAPRRPPALRSVWTMLASAYWHGLHPGFYLSFLSVPLWLAAERAAERALRGRLSPRGWSLAAGPHWFLKMRAYDYLCMGFVLRDAAATLSYWASIYFCLHLLPLAILLLAAIAGPGPEGDSEGKKGEREANPDDGDPDIAKKRDSSTLRDPKIEEGGDDPSARDPKIQEEGGGSSVRKRRDPRIQEGGTLPSLGVSP